jgi:hypothetical protein
MSCLLPFDGEGGVELLKGLLGQRSDETDDGTVFVHNLVGVDWVALWLGFLEHLGDVAQKIRDPLNTFLLVQLSEGHGGDWGIVQVHVLPRILMNKLK